MDNLHKYGFSYCTTCTWSCTGIGCTQCDMTDNCTTCDNYNHELTCCKCAEQATDAAKCPYYKKYIKEEETNA